ncbi:polymorphic toxin-type HINT domain-containing protein [Pirellulales bacterium]|nr:polymorphic toxin-type HINT domain-containing protein [Pirellulales bacterium]
MVDSFDFMQKIGTEANGSYDFNGGRSVETTIVDSVSTNVTETVNTSGTATEESTFSGGGNTVSGFFARVDTTLSGSEIQETTENQTLTVDSTISSSQESTYSITGNSIVGGFSSTRNDLVTMVHRRDEATNQTERRVSDITTIGSGTSFSSGNRILGDFSTNSGSMSSRSGFEQTANDTFFTPDDPADIPNSALQVTSTLVSSSLTNSSNRAGNTITGVNGSTQGSTSDETWSEVSRNQTLNSGDTVPVQSGSATVQITSANTTDTPFGANSITGDHVDKLQTQSQTTRRTNETQENQTLTVSTDESRNTVDSTTLISRGNDVTGEYEGTTNTVQQSLTVNQVAVNQIGSVNETRTVDSDSSSTEQSAVTGSSVTGEFDSIITEASSISGSVEIVEIKSQYTRVESESDSMSTGTRTGNSISGASTSVMQISEANSFRNEDIENLTLTVSNTFTNESAGTIQSDNNAITGVYSSTETMSVDSTETSESTNTLQDPVSGETYDVVSASEVRSITAGHPLAVRTSSGNQVTGAYVSTYVETVDSSSNQSSSNQSQSTIGGSGGEKTTSSTESGNSISGEFQSSQDIAVRITEGSDELRNTGDPGSTEFVHDSVSMVVDDEIYETSVTRNGNSVIGNFTGTTESSASTFRIETSRNRADVGTIVDTTTAPRVETTSSSTSAESGNAITGLLQSSSSGEDRTLRTDTFVNNYSPGGGFSDNHLTVVSMSDVSTTYDSQTTANSITGVLVESTSHSETEARVEVETSTNQVEDKVGADEGAVIELVEIVEPVVTFTTTDVTRSGDTILGNYVSDETSVETHFRKDLRTNQTVLEVMTTVNSETTRISHSEGNTITGALSLGDDELTSTSTTAEVATTTVQNSNIVDQITTTSTNTSSAETDRTGNTILGSFTGNSSSDSSTSFTSLHLNQMLTVDASGLETTETTTDGYTQNNVVGTYLGTTVITGTRTAGETITNQTLTAQVDDVVTINSITTTRANNSILGTFTETTITDESTERIGSDTNGLLPDDSPALVVSYTENIEFDDTTTTTGNSLTGMYSGSTSFSERHTDRDKTDENQTLKVESTLVLIETTLANDFSGSSITGESQADQSIETDSTRTDVITNQTLSTTVVETLFETRDTLSRSNAVTGQIESSDSVLDGMSTFSDDGLNQGATTTLSDVTNYELTTDSSGNSVLGDSEFTETRSLIETTSNNTYSNKTETVTETQSTTGDSTTTRTSNAFTGEYEVDTVVHTEFLGDISDPDDPLVRRQSQTNQTLTVIAAQTGMIDLTDHEEGNAITGAYLMASTTSTQKHLEEQDLNQVLDVLLTVDETRTDTVDETGNRIDGSYNRTTGSDTSVRRVEDNDIDPFSDITVVSTSVSSATQTGNPLDGSYTFTGLDSSESTLTETFTYEDLTVNLTETSISAGTSSGSGNEVLGDSTSTSTSSSSSATTRTETNQTISVSLTGTSTSSSTVESTDNSITGAYSSTDTFTSSSTSSETSTNQSLTVEIDAVGSSEGTTTSSGNSVTGDFTSTTASTYANTTNETDTNQTRTIDVEIVSSGSDMQTESGNAITGATTSSGTSTYSIDKDQTETNQTLTIVVDETTTGSSTNAGTSNLITAVYTSSTDDTSTTMLTESEANQTQTRTLNQTTESTTASSRNGNSITGEYTLSASTEDDVTLSESLTNQTLTVTTSQTEDTTTTVSETGSDRFRDYDRTQTVATTVITDQTTANQTYMSGTSRTATTTSTTTRVGNSVVGDYTETLVIDGTATNGGASSNQTLTSISSHSSTNDSQTDRAGNDITGTYSVTTTATNSLSTTHSENNTDQEIDSTSINSSSSTLTESGNAVTGAFTRNLEQTDTSSQTQTGTLGATGDIGERSFTTTESTTMSLTVDSSGNIITTAATSSESTSDDYSYEKETIYSDGTDDKTVARTGSSSSSRTANAITGAFSGSSTSETDTSITENGTRGNTYALTATIGGDVSSADSGNAITGAYDQSSTSTSDGTQTRTVTGSASGDFTITEDTDAESTVGKIGNAITGTYTSTSDATHSVISDQTTTSADSQTTFTVHDEMDLTSDSTGSGNDITGAYTESTTGSYTDVLTQTGNSPDGDFAYNGTTTDNSTAATTGNFILGERTVDRTGQALYNFTQTVSNAPNNYTLTGSGTKDYTSTEDHNTISGELNKVTTGSDEYDLTQTGTDATGAYTIDVSGTDGFTVTETTNVDTGGYDRTTDIDGTYNRTETRNGSPANTAGAIDYILEQTGNYLDGSLTITNETNTSRYALLNGFLNTTNPATGTAGVLDFTPVGAPLRLGTGPTMPTGRGVEPLSPTSADEVFSQATEVNGSMADEGVRGLESQSIRELEGGQIISGASTVDGFANLGIDASYQYCFVAGTLVLMADGSSKAIESVQPGDRVLAVMEDDPEGNPNPATVRKSFANEPAKILELHIGDENVRATYGHPFYVAERGWTNAIDLNPGDKLRTSIGEWISVSGLRKTEEVLEVYNLEVSECHSYFVAVGECFVLVHNESQSWEDWFSEQWDITVGYWSEVGSEVAQDVSAIGSYLAQEYKEGGVVGVVGEMIDASGTALVTTGQALGNATLDTIWSTVTIGTRDSFKEDFGFNFGGENKAGYQGAYIASRISTEILAGIGTGSLSVWAKAGKLGRVGGAVAKTIFAMDVGASVVGVGRGSYDMYQAGEVTVSGALQVGFGGLGLAGAARGLKGACFVGDTVVLVPGCFVVMVDAVDTKLSPAVGPIELDTQEKQIRIGAFILTTGIASWAAGQCWLRRSKTKRQMSGKRELDALFEALGQAEINSPRTLF